MTDPAAASSVCPWCSAEVPAGRTTCPACGANLVEANEAAVPGLTAIDAEAVLRNIRTAGAAPRRNRILSLITGEEPDDGDATPGSPTALAPPPLDVRREMLRMEIAAELSNLTAEVDSIAADEALDAQSDGTAASVASDRTVAAEADADAGAGVARGAEPDADGALDGNPAGDVPSVAVASETARTEDRTA
jgi:zinc-ribbon domain